MLTVKLSKVNYLVVIRAPLGFRLCFSVHTKNQETAALAKQRFSYFSHPPSAIAVTPSRFERGSRPLGPGGENYKQTAEAIPSPSLIFIIRTPCVWRPNEGISLISTRIT